jgi:hypothetical protein
MLSSPVLSPRPHAHLSGDHCPTCDQPIPNDRLDEVNNRIAAKERLLRAEVDARAKAEIQAVRAQGEVALQALTAQLAEREQVARKDGEMRAAAAFEKRMAEHAETAAAKLAEIEAVRGETERRLAELLATQEETVNGRVAEAREAMEKVKTEAVNAERSKNFDEKMKLEGMVADLQRKLQNKTAEELGDGPEVDLFEILKAEFPSDDIQRVGRGKPGADVIHKVRHNGAICGTIVYDSKNHKQWRTEFVTKLRQDQIAEKAEHAVLATRAFPKDAKQLHIDSGVILADPARAVVIAMLLRQQVIKVYSLAVSNNERASKTEELYSFMTSDRFGQFLSTVTRGTEQLEALQAAEKKAHESTWKKQGELFRVIVRNCAQFDEEIARIIGTAPVEAS